VLVQKEAEVEAALVSRLRRKIDYSSSSTMTSTRRLSAYQSSLLYVDQEVYHAVAQFFEASILLYGGFSRLVDM
jgi:hypothetical protein